jgi:hypothetical protein
MGTIPMPKIFISYRRQDSQAITGRLYDHLEAHFGQGAVFLDEDTIPDGADFRRYIDQAVSRCDVLLAVIGAQWVRGRYQEGPRQGQRRLDDPADFVRIEVQSALARGIPVIPVLVEKANMPAAQDLPEELQALPYRNAAEVRAGRDFRDDVARLIQSIESLALRKAGRRQVSKSADPPGAEPGSYPRSRPSPLPTGWNSSGFWYTLVGAAWLVAAVLWGAWTYWLVYRVGDRDRGRLPEDPTPKIWVCVAGATLLVALLAWVFCGVRRFRSQGMKRP